jgi:hypothetical protein
MSNRKGHKVSLEAVIHPHSPVLSDSEQLFLVRPAKAFDRALIPLEKSAKTNSYV